MIDTGFWLNGSRWSAVKHVGLVDLTAASMKLRSSPGYIQPRIKQASDALLNGYGAKEVAQVAGVERSTAWNYITVAAQAIATRNPEALLHITPRLVAGDLWSVLKDMIRSRDERVGGRLNALKPVVDTKLSPSGPFRSLPQDEQMAELRFARLALQAQPKS